MDLLFFGFVSSSRALARVGEGALPSIRPGKRGPRATAAGCAAVASRDVEAAPAQGRIAKATRASAIASERSRIQSELRLRMRRPVRRFFVGMSTSFLLISRCGARHCFFLLVGVPVVIPGVVVWVCFSCSLTSTVVLRLFWRGFFCFDMPCKSKQCANKKNDLNQVFRNVVLC